MSTVDHVIDVFEEQQEGVSTTLSSVTLSQLELKRSANNTPDLIRYAKALAGTTLGPDRIYVDGLPSSSLPPAEAIAQITVNRDPFSAEYAESDRNHIEITTKSPDRQLRFNFSGASLGFGGGSVLASDTSSTSRSTMLGVTGPIPRSPLTFSMHASLGYFRQDQPILATTLQDGSGSGASLVAPTTDYTGSVYFSTDYSRSETVRANFSFYESRVKSSNTNVGGLTLLEAGMGSVFTTREARATLEMLGTHHIYRGGVVLNRRNSHAWANNTDLGIAVLDSFVAGGPTIADSRIRQTSWTWKNVVRSNSIGRSWSAGATISRFADSDFELPNIFGLMQFETLQDYDDALAGAPTGTWYVARGNGQVKYTSTAAAAFVQGELLRSRKAMVRGGLRTDYQTRGGVLFSPRLYGEVQLHRFTLRGGAGIFVHNWPNAIFVQTMKADPLHLQRFLVKNVSFVDLNSEIQNTTPLIVSSISPDLARSRHLMLRGSIEGRFGHFIPAAEYTWTNGTRLLGSRRLTTQTGWMDLLESGHLLRKHQLHLRLNYQWKGQSITAHYEWIHSRDNTDGPFSFPERQDDIGAEWARTTGVAPHNFNLVARFKLPSAVSVSLVATSRSSVPYNVTSSVDRGANGLFNDRAGRARNSGIGPAYNSLALFAHRRIQIPHFLVRSKEKVYADVGLQGDNLLGNKNYLSLGSVIGSPLFGKPFGAFPDRSLRLS
ncbi:hypothetical protein MYX65_10570, partial [Acidobacteria bacterium AH-259-L09]|nr:hypothetical protein [Acidobacteria bacterium AH-259-L09]